MSAAYSTKKPWCQACRGSGVTKEGARYVQCGCGRLPNATGSAKLARQKVLEDRLVDIKSRGW